MTIRTPLSLTFLLAITVALLSNSNGVAHQQNKDRTGAPGSDNTCQQCHSGGSFSPALNAFMVVEGDMALSDTYMPGATHTLVVSLSSTGDPAGFGVHGTAVFANGSNAGMFNDQDANDCIWLDEVNGRHIFEQNDLCSSGTFEVEWVAPPAGSGAVTVYVASVVANGNGVASGDVFEGASFTFDETVTGVAEASDSTPFGMHASEQGQLQLSCAEGHHTSVLSLDGRLLFEGDFAAGQHAIILSHSGLVVVHVRTANGTVHTRKVWCP